MKRKICCSCGVKERHDVMANKKKLGVGVAAAGVVAGAVAAGVAVYKRSKSEQVNHEAELKAMDELEDMNVENQNACESCECAEECAASGTECDPVEEQVEIEEAVEAEASEEETPAEEAAVEEVPAEDAEEPADAPEEEVSAEAEEETAEE